MSYYWDHKEVPGFIVLDTGFVQPVGFIRFPVNKSDKPRIRIPYRKKEDKK